MIISTSEGWLSVTLNLLEETLLLLLSLAGRSLNACNSKIKLPMSSFSSCLNSMSVPLYLSSAASGEPLFPS
jgi:hypothetical protein